MGTEQAARPKTRRRRKVLVAGAATLGAIVLYGMIVPPRRPQVTRHNVALAGLSPQLSGLRVVQLSDVHLGFFSGPSFVRRAVALANAENPDLVGITGDFVNYRSVGYLPAGVRELQALRPRLGVFACLGNHEHWEGVEKVVGPLRAGGIQVLVNESRQVADNLWVAGLDDIMSGKPDLPRTVSAIPPGAAVILLSHNPTVLPQVADHPWLVLAGHTHGGQLALPFIGPRGTMKTPGIRQFARFWESVHVRARGGNPRAVCTYRYPEGWFQEGRARMYVNRGVGMSDSEPLRLNCPPEVAVFTLTSG